MFPVEGDPQYQAIAQGLAALQKAPYRFPEEDAKAFLALLDRAFPDKSPLPAEELLKEKYARREAKALELFGDKAPQDIPADVLRAHWSHYCYFSPKAWARLLPAFLRAAVMDGRRDYLHSVLFMLRPDWCALYDGTEAHAEDEALGEEGAKAVAAFLELALDCPGRLEWDGGSKLPHGMGERELHGAEGQFRRMAVEALVWRFDRVETAALAKARKEHEALTRSGIPAPEEREAKAVAALVRAAFKDTPAPAPDDMTGSALGDEPFEYAVQFRGADWRTLSVPFLSTNSAALSFLSDAAFRYFVPAFMLAELSGLEWNGDPVFHLTHGLSQDDNSGEESYDWAAIARRRFGPFTADEREAVAAFLRFEGARYAQNDTRLAEALEGFWEKRT